LFLKHSHAKPWSLVAKNKGGAFLTAYLSLDAPPKPNKDLIDALSCHGCRLEDFLDSQYEKLVSLFLKYRYAEPWSLIVKGKGKAFLRAYLSTDARPKPDATLIEMVIKNGGQFEELPSADYERLLGDLLQAKRSDPLPLLVAGKEELFIVGYLRSGSTSIPQERLLRRLSELDFNLSHLAEETYGSLLAYVFRNPIADPFSLAVQGRLRIFLDAYRSFPCKMVSPTNLRKELSRHGFELSDLSEDDYKAVLAHLFDMGETDLLSCLAPGGMCTILAAYESLGHGSLPVESLSKRLTTAQLAELHETDYQTFIEHVLIHGHPEPLSFLVPERLPSFVAAYMQSGSKAIHVVDFVNRLLQQQFADEQWEHMHPLVDSASDRDLLALLNFIEDKADIPSAFKKKVTSIWTKRPVSQRMYILLTEAVKKCTCTDLTLSRELRDGWEIAFRSRNMEEYTARYYEDRYPNLVVNLKVLHLGLFPGHKKCDAFTVDGSGDLNKEVQRVLNLATRQ